MSKSLHSLEEQLRSGLGERVTQVGDRFTYSGYVWPTLPASAN